MMPSLRTPQDHRHPMILRSRTSAAETVTLVVSLRHLGMKRQATVTLCSFLNGQRPILVVIVTRSVCFYRTKSNYSYAVFH
jgi:hypothetical protein